MLYGTVPYDADNIENLLNQIYDRGPQFYKKKISKKIENLIRSLLEANPASRMNHNTLFEIVLKDPNFPNSLLDEPSSPLSTAAMARQRKSDGSDEALISTFTKEVLFERSKYKFLIDLASKATYFKKYSSN